MQNTKSLILNKLNDNNRSKINYICIKPNIYTGMRPRFYTFLFTFLVNVIFCLNIFSKQLNVRDALSAAIESTKPLDALTRQNILNTTQATTESNYSLLHTEQAEELNTVYIMESQTDNRVIFISADDVARPLLGWCDASTFDITNLPPALQYMLDSYSKEICIASAAGAAPYSPQSSDNRPEIAPLITTKWHQTAPYNLLCPEDSDRRCVTGCVATAMAQIVNYHKYPTHGQGENSVVYNGQTYSMNFEEQTFEYANMLNDYTGDYTDNEAKSVAQLMYACGIACNTTYGLGASGSGSKNAALGLVRNLGYSSATVSLEKDFFTYNEWFEQLYNELSAKRPILYTGVDKNIYGHAFILDGYAPNEYFHINWGWGGSSDGYFQLFSTKFSYNNAQEAIIGLQPKQDTDQIRANVCSYSNFIPKQSTYSISDNIDFDNYLFNRTASPFDFELGLAIKNLSTGQTDTVHTGELKTTLTALGTIATGFKFSASLLPDEGTVHEVSPIAFVNGTPQQLFVSKDYQTAFRYFIDDQTIVIEAIEQPLKKIKIVPEGSIPEYLYLDETTTVSVSVTNIGNADISDYLYLYLQPESSTNLITLSSYYIYLPKDKETTASFRFNPSSASIQAGRYNLVCNYYGGATTGNSGTILKTVMVKTERPQTESPDLSVNLICSAQQGDGTESSPWQIDETTSFIATVSNNSGTYNDYLYMVPSISGFIYKLLPGFNLDTDENTQVTFSGIMFKSMGEHVSGKKYYFRFLYRYGSLYYFPETYYYTIVETAGIEEIKTDDDGVMIRYADGRITVESAGGIRQVDVFTTQGSIIASATYPYPDTKAEISIDALPGIYIIRATTNGGKTVAQKVAIR